MKHFDLQLFDPVGPTVIEAGQNYNTPSPINVTGQDSMAVTMKVFYDTSLLENAREQMVFTQLGKKQPMKGNTVEWRKFNTFDKALDPLTEGVIPTGKTFGMTNLTAHITQHGDFTAVSDRLELESYDDIIYGATEEMGAAEGETFDTLTRNILVRDGNCVVYGDGSVSARANIAAGKVLTPETVAKVATWLKNNKAPKIDGSYVGVIHPFQAYDLRKSEYWTEAHKYADVQPIFNGEIGTLHGIRFIESTNAPIFEKAGASNTDVYAALFMGKDAFGVLDPQGEGMEMIIKDRHQAGGPLDQFSTIGYKFCHGAAVLYQERLLRVETASSFNSAEIYDKSKA